jgi:hypothetical protein
MTFIVIEPNGNMYSLACSKLFSMLPHMVKHYKQEFVDNFKKSEREHYPEYSNDEWEDYFKRYRFMENVCPIDSEHFYSIRGYDLVPKLEKKSMKDLYDDMNYKFCKQTSAFYERFQLKPSMERSIYYDRLISSLEQFLEHAHDYTPVACQSSHDDDENNTC